MSSTESIADAPSADAPSADDTAQRVPSVEPLRLRYRIRFAKTGLLRWTSHRDLARLWERLLRRAQLKLSMTEGFHPKPRISFPSALALGISGINEVVELDLAERLSADELFRRLVCDDQPGLLIKSVQSLPEGSGKAKIDYTEYRITTPDPELGAVPIDENQLHAGIQALLSQETVTVPRKNNPASFAVRGQILSLRFTNGNIELSMAASDAAILKPTDVLDLIGCSDWISHGSQITRTEVVLKQEFETTDPEFLAIANQTPPSGEPTPEVPE